MMKFLIFLILFTITMSGIVVFIVKNAVWGYKRVFLLIIASCIYFLIIFYIAQYIFVGST